MADLIPGQFYMVIIANDPDATHDWEHEEMPARFAGYDEQGHQLWNFLNPDAVEWPVRYSTALLKPPSSLARQVADAKAEYDSWSPEKRSSVVLEGSSDYPERKK